MAVFVLAFVLVCLFLSCFSSFALNKPHASVLLVILASNQMAISSAPGTLSHPGVIYAVLFAAILHFLTTLLSANQNKAFLLISLLPIAYILVIFYIKPYKINTDHYLGYLAALFIFAWIMLLKWDTKNVVNFLTAYGSILILSGIFEKLVVGSPRIGLILTGATAYGVVISIVWTIWTINSYLSKMHSTAVIFAGTLLTFVAIILSGTRMSLIGLFAGLGLICLSAIIIRNDKASIIKVALYSVGIVAMLVLLSVIMWNVFPDNLYLKAAFSSMVEGDLDKSNAKRVLAWICGIDLFERNKLLGIGPGNFYNEMKLFLNASGISLRDVPAMVHAHNIYIVTLSEHGIVGFLVLSTFISLCLLQLFLYFLKDRHCPEFFSIFSGFAVIAVLGLVDAIPLFLPSASIAAWMLGVSASFRARNSVC